MNGKVSMPESFDIHKALRKVEIAVQGYPKAALFELFDDGYTSVFEMLMACIISVRTLDEVTLVCSRRLFKVARTPASLAALSANQIDEVIHDSTFHERKAQQMKTIATRILSEHDGALPCDYNVLTSFNGVGPKCANLVLGIACQQNVISVDIHVHRVTNRWGYVHASTPEKTLSALETKLPLEYHVAINRLLVPFGKHLCTGRQPHCSTCPLLSMCPQIGVTTHK